MNTLSSFTIFYDVVVAVYFIYTICRSNGFIGRTIFCKDIPICRSIRVVFDKTSTGIHIGISAEIVGLSFHFNPHTCVIARTVAVSCASCIGRPSTHGRTVFVKSILNSIYSLFANVKFVIGACKAVAFVCGLPTGLQYAIDRIVEITVHLKYACSRFINKSTVFVCAYELAVNDYIVVSNFNLRNDSSPINYRLTSLTIGSILIARISSSCFLIENGKFCIVNVVGRRNCCEFGSYIDCSAERNIVNSTVNNVNIDVYYGLVVGCGKSHLFIVHIVITVERPNANRNAYKSVIESLTTYTVFFNGYSEDFRNLVVFQCSLEAVSNDSTLGFPSVSVIKLKLCYEFVYVCEIRNVDVNIVDGLCLRSFAGIVVTAKLNYCFTCNSEGTGDLHGVAKLVLNLKCNGMNTCTESNVALSGKHIAVDRGFYNNAVNGDLTGGKVKSCVICNGCGERNVVTVDNLAVIKRNSNVGGRISRIGNSGKHSIVNSRAVVKSDIVNVECKLSGSSRLYIRTNKGRRAGVCCCCVGIHCRKVKITGNINGHVYPTRFGNIRFSSRV